MVTKMIPYFHKICTDGLEGWATHVAYIGGGKLQFLTPVVDVPQLASGETGSMLRFVEGLLRAEAATPAANGYVGPGGDTLLMNNGWGAGRLTPTVKLGAGDHRGQVGTQ